MLGSYQFSAGSTLWYLKLWFLNLERLISRTFYLGQIFCVTSILIVTLLCCLPRSAIMLTPVQTRALPRLTSPLSRPLLLLLLLWLLLGLEQLP